MRTQLAQAKVYVFESEAVIRGFLGMTGTYVAGLFVDRASRSRGVGAQLLAYVKQTNDVLSLNVYQKNKRAVSFYLREGFEIQSQEIDASTGEAEYAMLWNAKKKECGA